jgi:hypothetical protein
MTPRKVLAVGTLGALLGCATAPAAGPEAQSRPPEEASAYYPFSTGWKWAYSVEREGETLLATYAVTERTSDTAIVQAGEQRLSYALVPEGIVRREGLRSTDYVLRTPIRAGASWSLEGGKAQVASVDKVVSVPAGTFPGCATIEESRTNPDRITRTVYCVGVGPVSIEVQVHDPLSGAFRTEMRAALLGVTRPGEDPLGPGGGLP